MRKPLAYKKLLLLPAQADTSILFDISEEHKSYKSCSVNENSLTTESLTDFHITLFISHHLHLSCHSDWQQTPWRPPRHCKGNCTTRARALILEKKDDLVVAPPLSTQCFLHVRACRVKCKIAACVEAP